MKDCRGSYIHRPTENEKRERKIKNHKYTCKCVNPSVKLHYHDCPAVLKSCPIHGKEKITRREQDQNVIISFHPSSKTEKLLQPIKSLLTNCNSKTKINFQYYTPEKETHMDSMKPLESQNPGQNVKKGFSNTFLERTKSYVSEKTSRVKKLKQCFNSPGNSFVQNTRSQTSIKGKLNCAFSEDIKRNVFYKIIPDDIPDEIIPDDKNDWFYSSVGGAFNYREKLSEGKLKSDFITVTQHDSKNIIHHNIFELKNDSNEISFVDFAKPSNQLVYGLFNKNKQPKEKRKKGQMFPLKKKKNPPVEQDTNRNLSDHEETTNRTSSSDSSVYVTPFLFLPKTMAGSKVQFEDKFVETRDSFSEAEELVEKAIPETTEVDNTKFTQTSATALLPVSDSKTSEPKSKSVLLQTNILDTESMPQNISQLSDTSVEEMYFESNAVLLTKGSHYTSGKQSTINQEKSRTVEVQTSRSFQFAGVCVSSTGERGMKDQKCQTMTLWNEQVSIRTLAPSKVRESQGTTPSYSNKGVQTDQFESSNKPSASLPYSSNVTQTFEEQEPEPSVHTIKKTWWGKSRSDTEVFEAPQCVYHNHDHEQLILKQRVRDDGVNEEESEPVVHCVTLRTKETIQRVCNKETSSKEKEFTASASDLSDLKKLIQEFFDKDNNSDRLRVRIASTESEGTTDSQMGVQNQAQDSAQKPIKNFISRSTFSNVSGPLAIKVTTAFQTSESAFCGRHEVIAETDDANDPKVNTQPQIDKSDYYKPDYDKPGFNKSGYDKVDAIAQTDNTDNPKVHTTAQTDNTDNPKVHRTAQTDNTDNPKVHTTAQTDNTDNPKVHTTAQTDSTSNPKIHAEAQTEKKSKGNPSNPRISNEAQTDVKVLLRETLESDNDKKVVFLRTAADDPENQKKFHYICTLCSRDIKRVNNTGTNTINVTFNKMKTSNIEQTCDIHLRASKIKAPSAPSKNIRTIKEPVNYHKRETENVTQRYECNPPQSSLRYRSKIDDNQLRNTKGCASTCKGGCKEEPMVAVYMKNQNPGPACPFRSESADSVPESKDSKESNQQQKTSNNTKKSDSKKRRTEIIYSVLTTHFWPRSLSKNWKLTENSLSDSHICCNSPEQKYNLEEVPKSFKKPKLELPYGVREPALTGLLTVDKNGELELCKTNQSECQINSNEKTSKKSVKALSYPEEVTLTQPVLTGILAREKNGGYKFFPFETTEQDDDSQNKNSNVRALSYQTVERPDFNVQDVFDDSTSYPNSDNFYLVNYDIAEEPLLPQLPPTKRFCTNSASSFHKSLDDTRSITTTRSLSTF